MLNRVSIMGRVAREIDLRQTQSGVSYAKFSIAVERNMVNKSTGKRDVDFVEMEAWKNTADLLCDTNLNLKTLQISSHKTHKSKLLRLFL